MTEVGTRPSRASGPAVPPGPALDHPHRHLVGVYDRDEELIVAVASFVVDALEQAGAAVVIATAAHRVALDEALAARGVPVGALVADGRYRSLDARETLATFMLDGRPDPHRFAAVTGALLAEVAAAGGPVCVFGEMVALLWEDGSLEAALELESCWNDLARRHAFVLFCGYALAALEASGDLVAAKRMCECHSEVVPLPRATPAAREAGPVADTHERLFVAAPTTPQDVRMFVRDVLGCWGEGDLDREVEIIASELATNAVRHAASPSRVSLSRTAATIRIAVRDASFVRPEYVRRDDGAVGGRGVRLVASLARAWGTDDEADGKTVWAEVARRPRR